MNAILEQWCWVRLLHRAKLVLAYVSDEGHHLDVREASRGPRDTVEWYESTGPLSGKYRWDDVEFVGHHTADCDETAINDYARSFE